ncbi:MAG: hypothetical protein ACXAC5_04735 [Promethearchaeota archaeon]
MTKEEEDTIIEDNKYLNKEFDISEILAFGNIPEFNNAADRFVCARQVGIFINKNGLGNHDNLIKFLKSVPSECRLACIKEWDLLSQEMSMKNPKYKFLVKEMLVAVVDI